MKKIAVFFIAMALFGCPLQYGLAKKGLSGTHSWACFYSSVFPPNSKPLYDLYVFQPESHPDLNSLKERGAKVIGYVSIGELEKTSPAFLEFSSKNLIVDENENWPNSFRVDLRSPVWQDFVLKRLVPNILSQGFDGIFLDTVDVAYYLENEKGMKSTTKKTALLIKKIRDSYPDAIIIINNGLFLLEEVGDTIDAVSVEDTFTKYDFDKKKYLIADSAWTEERLMPLKKFQNKFKKPVLSLDYVKSSNKQDIKRVFTKAAQEGFIPYIAEIGLDTIFFHPSRWSRPSNN